MAAVSLILKAVAEIAMVLFLLWGFINENKLVRFEKKIFKAIKKLRQKRRALREEERAKELTDASFPSEYETERRSADKNTQKRKSQRSRVA
ncbi:MAG: hypothetical protein IJB86_10315 [Clostridia bacterium]|nr:hypothetical protein [Clostridia bacterium]